MTGLSPGASIGILGGGQLGRMLAIAAARHGLDVHIYSDEGESPAGRVSVSETVASYMDYAAVRQWAERCDVVTYEFENVDHGAALAAAEYAPVRPTPDALLVAGERLREKQFAEQCGAQTTAYAPVDQESDLGSALETVGLPAILKTRTQGYDGKGQVRVRLSHELPKAWAGIGEKPAILERLVTFDRELSLIAARGLEGELSFYDLVENRHEHGVLRETTAPAQAAEHLAAKAQDIAAHMLEALGYVGVLAIEFFQVGDDLLVNEIAPRVHNTGHWTIEGANCDQFAQHIRAIAGWPLGSTLCRGRWRMRNLLGGEIRELNHYWGDPNAFGHHYGKREVAPGRKMGHITFRESDIEAGPRSSALRIAQARENRQD